MPTGAETNRILQAILDAAVDGVVLIGHTGLIEAFNRAAQSLFGFSAEEVVGKNVRVLMTEGDAAAHDEHMARYLRTGTAHIIGRGRQVIARRKDGRDFPVFLSVGVVPGAQPPRFLGFLHDLTAERQADERNQRLQERLTHVSRLATLGEIAAGIAHEVNQPLAAITNYAQACVRLLVAPDADIEEIREALREIAGQAVRAGDIVHRLRGIARAPDPQRRPLSINSLLMELNELLQGQARRAEVSCTVDLGSDLPLVLVDGSQIQQVVLNLVRNALEALAGPHRTPKQILISTYLDGDHDVALEVCDSAEGISAGTVERLFEPFFTTKEAGTGLGLAMSRTIIESHGGRLDYRPHAPQGSCFTLRLPTL